MKGLTYRIHPIFILAFFRVSIATAIGLAIPLYYSSINIRPEIIGLIISARSLAYLFSPFLLKNVPNKIGFKKSLQISIGGFFIIYILLRVLLTPFWSFLLLLLDGILLGLFWPVLISSVSVISNFQEIREKESIKDKLLKNYGLSWNMGGIFSFLLGSLLLFIISNIILVFQACIIFCLINLIVVFLFQDPKRNKEITELEGIHPLGIDLSPPPVKLSFPSYIPLFLITLYAFSISSLGLIFPLKSDSLLYDYSITYFLSFIRLSAQTLSISLTMSLPIKILKKLIPFLALIVSCCFLLMGFNEDIVVFGILFLIFGITISVFYSFSFKLIVHLNTVKNTSKYSVYYETMVGFNFWLSPLICGFLAAIDINVAFYFMALLMLIGLGIYLILYRELKIL